MRRGGGGGRWRKRYLLGANLAGRECEAIDVVHGELELTTGDEGALEEKRERRRGEEEREGGGGGAGGRRYLGEHVGDGERDALSSRLKKLLNLSLNLDKENGDTYRLKVDREVGKEVERGRKKRNGSV